MNVNYKSDFTLILKAADASGAPFALNEFSWTAIFRTSLRTITHTAARTADGSYIAAAPLESDPAAIMINFDGHGLPPGPLAVELAIEIPDGTFPDGFRRVAIRKDLGVRLCFDPDQLPGDVTADVTVPVLAVGVDILTDFIDDFNRRINNILGGKAPAVASSPAAATFQRGIISVFAPPGVIYRHSGQMRMPLGYDSDSRTFDISAVPEEIRVDKGLGNKITLTRHPDQHARTGCRLRLITGDPGAYIWKNPKTGMFELLDDSTHIAQTHLPAPVAPDASTTWHFKNGDLHSYLKDISGGRRIQVQRWRTLFFAEIGSEENQTYRRRWITYPWDPAESRWAQTREHNQNRMGLIRVRFRSRSGRHTSPWTLIAYRYSAQEGHFYARQV